MRDEAPGITGIFGSNHLVWIEMIAKHLAKNFPADNTPLRSDLACLGAKTCADMVAQASAMIAAIENARQSGMFCEQDSHEHMSERERDEEIIRKMFPIY